MFGSVSEWFYKAIAGISVADDAVGADKLLLRPNPVGDLTWAEGEYSSIRGIVATRWRIEGDKLLVEAQVPVGTTASLFLPATDPASVREGNRPADQAAGVRLVGAEHKELVYNLFSGKYKFVVQGYLKRLD